MTAKKRPSGVTVKTNRDGSIVVKSYGPNAPDLRDVMPGLLGKKTTQRRELNGQYTHAAGAMCVCGCSFGTHTSEPPHECTECTSAYLCDGFVENTAKERR